MTEFDWDRWQRKMRRLQIIGYLISAAWVGVAIMYLGLALGWWQP